MLDVKIAGGRIIHGTGAPARAADVGISGDRIDGIGDFAREPAGRTISSTAASSSTAAPTPARCPGGLSIALACDLRVS
jgi:hypothetical protein